MGGVIFALSFKLLTCLGAGVAISSALKTFHDYEFKTKKKGGVSSVDNHSELLRERAKSLR